MTRRRAWILVALMAFALFLDDADRNAVYALFPVLKARLHFSDTQLGLIGSLFLWVYAFCSPIAGQLGDRFPKHRLLILSLLLWSVVTGLTGFATSVWMLLACRALLGISESLFVPTGMALLASAHGPRTRSLAMNLFYLGEYTGVAFGGWFAGYVAQEFNWRWVFYLLGLLGILFTIPYGRFLKSVDNAAPAPAPATVKAEPRRTGRASAATLLRIPSYCLLCAAFCVLACVVYLMYTWLPTFVYEKFSVSLAQAGFSATFFMEAGALVGSLSSALVADRLHHRYRLSRFWVCSVGFFAAAPCVYLVGHCHSLLLAKAAAVGVGVATGSLGNLLAAAYDVVPPEIRASACGYFNFVGLTSGGFASVLEGHWKQRVGIEQMITWASFACLAAGLMLLVCIRFFARHDYNRAGALAGTVTAEPR